MTPAGSVNAWKCDLCGSLTVAVHVHEGVTPMMLGCRATPGCRGMAVSAGYPPPPIPAHILDRLGWEWRQPSRTQMKEWKRTRDPMYDHCAKGGLVIAPLSDAGRTAVGAA